jgi:hypothetical protein
VEELPKLITVNEEAKQRNVHPDTLRRWVHQWLIAGVCLLPANRYQNLPVKQKTIDALFI